MIKIIQSTQEWNDFRTEWDELYESSSATPFQSFAFQYSSWENMVNDGTLHIIVVISDKDKSVTAIFPTYIDKHHVLRFINDRHTDFCSALCVDGVENFNFYKDVADYIKSNRQIKGVCFTNLLHTDRLLSSLRPFFKLAQVIDCNYYPKITIFKLESDKDSLDSIRSINASKKKKLRKIISNLHSPSLKILSLKQGNRFPECEIAFLIRSMVSRGIRSDDYFAKMMNFWRQLFNSGVLSICCYYESEEIYAINFVLYDEKRNEYIKWIMLYRDYSDNMKLNLLLVDHIYPRGGTINFARGIYDYKMNNYHPDVYPLFSLFIAKSTIQFVRQTGSIGYQYLKQVVKSIIRK